MKKGRFRRILLAVDSSDQSIRACKLAVMLAREQEAELIALYVVDSATIKELLLSKIFVDEESREYEASLEANGKKYLHYAMELAESKKVKLETVLERGTIYAKIIETALDREADLIVVGGRRVGMADGPGSRDLLSSEYAKVLRESPVSVLVAKSEEIEKEFRGF